MTLRKLSHLVLTKYYRGKFGDLIFRMVNGKSVISRAPDYSKYKWSKNQKASRKRFRLAATANPSFRKGSLVVHVSNPVVSLSETFNLADGSRISRG